MSCLAGGHPSIFEAWHGIHRSEIPPLWSELIKSKTPTNQPLGGNHMPRFGGPITMMRLPTQVGAQGLDACFVGVPFDIGTSNRAGARHGPRQIRAESTLLRPCNLSTRASPFNSLKIQTHSDYSSDKYYKCLHHFQVVPAHLKLSFQSSQLQFIILSISIQPKNFNSSNRSSANDQSRYHRTDC